MREDPAVGAGESDGYVAVRMPRSAEKNHIALHVRDVDGRTTSSGWTMLRTAFSVVVFGFVVSGCSATDPTVTHIACSSGESCPTPGTHYRRQPEHTYVLDVVHNGYRDQVIDRSEGRPVVLKDATAYTCELLLLADTLFFQA